MFNGGIKYVRDRINSVSWFQKNLGAHGLMARALAIHVVGVVSIPQGSKKFKIFFSES